MSASIPEKCVPDDKRLGEVLELIQRTFAYMDERIDPPSSMKRLTLRSLVDHCETGEIWVQGNPVEACVFLKEKGGKLYLGKLAVSDESRGRGLARKLVELAERRAHQLGLRELELEVRIELLENHRAFEKLGFSKISEGAHVGYDRPTFITMRKRLDS